MQETVIDQDKAAHRYESIPIKAEDEIRSGKSEDENETHEKTINYGYHPIIDFFGNFRFDKA